MRAPDTGRSLIGGFQEGVCIYIARSQSRERKSECYNLSQKSGGGEDTHWCLLTWWLGCLLDWWLAEADCAHCNLTTVVAAVSDRSGRCMASCAREFWRFCFTPSSYLFFYGERGGGMGGGGDFSFPFFPSFSLSLFLSLSVSLSNSSSLLRHLVALR